jgi:hypothetical protein
MITLGFLWRYWLRSFAVSSLMYANASELFLVSIELDPRLHGSLASALVARRVQLYLVDDHIAKGCSKQKDDQRLTHNYTLPANAIVYMPFQVHFIIIRGKLHGILHLCTACDRIGAVPLVVSADN